MPFREYRENSWSSCGRLGLRAGGILTCFRAAIQTQGDYMANEGDANINESRLEIEKERLQIERRKAALENRFLNRHFGALIAAMVSVGAVMVSGAQIWVAYIGKEKELEAQAIMSDREWKMEAAKFIITNQQSIFAVDGSVKRRMNYVIEIAFPDELAQELTERVRVAYAAERVGLWLSDLESSAVTQDRRNRLARWLESQGLDVSVTVFLHADDFAEEREAAIRDLNIE
jgi:hypothetical protein